jgi:hypothetical protein
MLGGPIQVSLRSTIGARRAKRLLVFRKGFFNVPQEQKFFGSFFTKKELLSFTKKRGAFAPLLTQLSEAPR